MSDYNKDCSFCGDSCLWHEHNEPLKAKSEEDKINHPLYYGGDTTYETIKVLKAWMTVEEYHGFMLGNTIKYLSRWGKKGGVEDLKKAKWYLDKLLEELS